MNRSFNLPSFWAKPLFFLTALSCLSPWVSPPMALFFGILYAQIFAHPYPIFQKKATSWLLKASVVGLGFGMNVQSAWEVGKEGFILTVTTLTGALVLGYFLGKLFKVEKITAYLISGGTAICGGSAIAALSPVVKASQSQISVALGVVFILNSLALFVFPAIGNLLNLSQADFGLWCAIAIHDTSSVVGAAAKYGDSALQVATTVKLARALWIIPLVFLSTFLFKSKGTPIKLPYFIGLFVIALFFNTYVPGVASYSPWIVEMAKAGLTLTLFLIGSSLSFRLLKSVGLAPIIQGSLLWVTISAISLMVILF